MAPAEKATETREKKATEASILIGLNVELKLKQSKKKESRKSWMKKERRNKIENHDSQVSILLSYELKSRA